MKHTKEVCPCTHTPWEPPQARQGINDPRPNKPTPRAPRRRPTAHVCILYSLYSRPPERKEAWYGGHPHGTERREPHAAEEHTTATTNTHTTNPGAHGEQEVYPHTQGPDKRHKRQKVWAKKKKKKKSTRKRPLLMETQANRGANAPTDQTTRQPPPSPPISLYRLLAPRKMRTPPRNTQRAKDRQHRGTEHEWYEGVPNGEPKRKEVMV